MSGPNDWIEAQLRTRRIEPTPDGGFSERMVAVLPTPRSARRWIVPTLSGTGALLTALTVPRAQWSSALALVAQPETFLVLALAMTTLVWIGSAWVLLDRRDRAL